MKHRPSINQVAILGRIAGIEHKAGRMFCWNFKVVVYREYGEEDETEAEVTCGVGKGCYGDMIADAKVGDWVAVQGKIRSNCFIQVRSMSFFEMG